MDKKYFTELSCGQCAHGAGLNFDFSFAFQPIVDFDSRSIGHTRRWCGGRTMSPRQRSSCA